MDAPRATVLLLCLLAISAGCVEVGLDSTPGPSGGDGTSGLPTVPGTPSEGVPATVVDVVDGDTVDVRYSNGETDTVRLLGVDTPEVHADNDPAEFEGVPETEAGAECLRSAGDAASAALTERIEGQEVTVVVDPLADRRDRYGRLLAYAEIDGTDLNHWLVAEGYARVYDSTFARSDRYYESESTARESGTGVWQCRSAESVAFETPTQADASTPLVIERIHADAAGNDNENLNDEYVVFRNALDSPLDVGGWTVHDDGGHSYVFSEGFSLAAGATVTLRTGSGSDTGETLYWGNDGALWNNGGDTVTVRNESVGVVVARSYS